MSEAAVEAATHLVYAPAFFIALLLLTRHGYELYVINYSCVEVVKVGIDALDLCNVVIVALVGAIILSVCLSNHIQVFKPERLQLFHWQVVDVVCLTFNCDLIVFN